MEFKLVYGNHGKNPSHILDTLLLIKFSLESLGHKADLEERMHPGKTNILLEGFNYDFLEAYKEIAKADGTEFIIVATEFMTGETFNDFEKDVSLNNTSHYTQSNYWKKRLKTFMIAQHYARSVWHLSDNQVRIYRESLDQTPVHYLPHGHTPEFARVVQKPWKHKDIDILFTGTITPYRAQILSRLENKKINVIKTEPINNIFREDIVARTKLSINIRQNDDWQFPSNSRYHYHLSNRSFIASEHCNETCDLSKYIEISPASQKFEEKCIEILDRGNLQQNADDALERFRNEMPMKALMANLIEKSFAPRHAALKYE